MATSKITICSNALLQLGTQPITSFEDGSDNSLLCSNLYDQTRDGVLRAHPWNCAIKRVSLAPSTVDPIYGFSFAFDLPGDVLRLLEADTVDEYKVEGRQILANENPFFIKYLYKNTEVASYDSLLVETLTWAMMAVLAYPVVKSTTKSTEINNIYLARLRQARAIDGQEGTPDALGRSQLLDARRSGGRRAPNT